MKYNQKVKQHVCILYHLGEKVTVISRATKIPRSTIYYWLKSYRVSEEEKKRDSLRDIKQITIKIRFK